MTRINSATLQKQYNSNSDLIVMMHMKYGGAYFETWSWLTPTKEAGGEIAQQLPVSVLRQGLCRGCLTQVAHLVQRSQRNSQPWTIYRDRTQKDQPTCCEGAGSHRPSLLCTHRSPSPQPTNHSQQQRTLDAEATHGTSYFLLPVRQWRVRELPGGPG